MTSIAVIVPVLARPANAGPVAESFRAASTDADLVFVASKGDRDEIAACDETGFCVLLADWEPGHADFQRKVNLAFNATEEPFVFQAADDVDFQPGWDVEALKVIEATQTGVCGTDDGANPQVKAGRHSTHSLIRRSYVDECGGSLDGPGIVFSEAYGHQWCDVELVELAKARGCFSFAPASRVVHRHPIWKTAASDDTYRKGQASTHEDRRLYETRSKGWAA